MSHAVTLFLRQENEIIFTALAVSPPTVQGFIEVRHKPWLRSVKRYHEKRFSVDINCFKIQLKEGGFLLLWSTEPCCTLLIVHSISFSLLWMHSGTHSLSLSLQPCIYLLDWSFMCPDARCLYRLSKILRPCLIKIWAFYNLEKIFTFLQMILVVVLFFIYFGQFTHSSFICW